MLTYKLVRSKEIIIPHLNIENRRQFVERFIEAPKVLFLLNVQQSLLGHVIQWENHSPVEVAGSIQRSAF